MNASELYDKLADKFYEETGIMAPGKDDVTGTHSYGVRRAEWENWRANLSEEQRKRLRFAVQHTYESMAMCGVPRSLKQRELEKVIFELLVKMKVDGETYPESEIEAKWRKRELNHWEYENRHLLKDSEF